MTSPKHLWAGDWEQESAASRAGGPNSLPRIPDPEPVAAPGPRVPDPEPAAVPRTHRQPRPRVRLRKPRIVTLSVLALLLIAGAAYGLTNLGAKTTKAAASTPWLGAQLAGWPAGGALVSSVASGSPAASAGLKPGDVIIQVQGRPVSGPINVSEALGALSVGNSLQILAVRGNHTFATTATLGARPPDTP
jgi:hypothetical protein